MTQPIDRNRLIEEALQKVIDEGFPYAYAWSRSDRAQACEWIADFTLSQLKIERQRIAGELRENVARYKTHRAQIASIKTNVIEKLEEKHDGE